MGIHPFFANRERREHETFNKLLKIASDFDDQIQNCSLDDVDAIVDMVIFILTLMASGLAHPKESCKKELKAHGRMIQNPSKARSSNGLLQREGSFPPP